MVWWLVYVLQIKSIVSLERAATLISKLLLSDAACCNSLLFISPSLWYTVLHVQWVIDNTHSKNTDIYYSSCGRAEVQRSAGTGMERKTGKFERNRAHGLKSSWDHFPAVWVSKMSPNSNCSWLVVLVVLDKPKIDEYCSPEGWIFWMSFFLGLVVKRKL